MVYLNIRVDCWWRKTHLFFKTIHQHLQDLSPDFCLNNRIFDNFSNLPSHLLPGWWLTPGLTSSKLAQCVKWWFLVLEVASANLSWHRIDIIMQMFLFSSYFVSCHLELPTFPKWPCCKATLMFLVSLGWKFYYII